MNGTLLTAVGHDGGVDGVVSARVPVSHRLVEHQFNDPAIYLIFTWYLPGHLAHTWCRCTRHGLPLPLVPLSHRLVEYQFHEPAIYPLFTCYLPGIYLVTWPTWCGCTRHGGKPVQRPCCATSSDRTGCTCTGARCHGYTPLPTTESGCT